MIKQENTKYERYQSIICNTIINYKLEGSFTLLLLTNQHSFKYCFFSINIYFLIS
jgi:hypothetical protein